MNILQDHKRSDLDRGSENEIDAGVDFEMNVMTSNSNNSIVIRCHKVVGQDRNLLTFVHDFGEYQVKKGSVVRLARLAQIENPSSDLCSFFQKCPPIDDNRLGQGA